jgi:undecaprenyl-diphosphatase
VPIVVVLVAGLIAGLAVALLVLRFPELDPTAPRVSPADAADVAKQEPVGGFLRARTNTQAVTGLLLTVALFMVLGAAIAIGALFVMERHNALLAHYDLSAARFGATNATSVSTRFLREVSLLGGTPGMIIIALAAVVYEFARTRVRAVFWFMLAVVIGQVILTNLTKYIVNRPRPDIARLTGFSGSSFPSGHAATAAATIAAAAFLFGRGRSVRVKAIVAGVAVGLAVAVATTRVLLGVHWLTDVLAGLALGWGWFALCSIAFGGRVLRFGQPVAAATKAAAATPSPG